MASGPLRTESVKRVAKSRNCYLIVGITDVGAHID
jgi:hypothetical protein